MINKKIHRTILIILLPLIIYAGELKDFEKEAKGDGEQDQNKESHDYSTDDDSENSFFAQLMGEIVKAVIVTGGNISLQRVGVKTDTQIDEEDYYYIQKRKKGEFLLPYFQGEVQGGVVNKNINNLNTRLESGFGPLALQYAQSYFYEHEPDESDHLFLHSTSVIYRMAFGNHFTMGIGAGVSLLQGSQETYGANFTFPFKGLFNNNWSIFYRPILNVFNQSAAIENKIGLVRSFGLSSVYVSYNRFSSGKKTLQGLGLGYSFCY